MKLYDRGVTLIHGVSIHIASEEAMKPIERGGSWPAIEVSIHIASEEAMKQKFFRGPPCQYRFNPHRLRRSDETLEAWRNWVRDKVSIHIASEEAMKPSLKTDSACRNSFNPHRLRRSDETLPQLWKFPAIRCFNPHRLRRSDETIQILPTGLYRRVSIHIASEEAMKPEACANLIALSVSIHIASEEAMKHDRALVLRERIIVSIHIASEEAMKRFVLGFRSEESKCFNPHRLRRSDETQVPRNINGEHHVSIHIASEEAMKLS